MWGNNNNRNSNSFIWLILLILIFFNNGSSISEADYFSVSGSEYIWDGNATYYGPITAMNFIYNATKDWVNIPDIVINYTSEEYGEIYSLQTSGNEVNIISGDGNVTASYTNLKARLPKIDEVEGEGKCSSAQDSWENSLGSCPLWLVNYMSESEYYSTSNGKVNISGIHGYDTLDAEICPTVLHVTNDGYSRFEGYCGTGIGGIRPVITLKL